MLSYWGRWLDVFHRWTFAFVWFVVNIGYLSKRLCYLTVDLVKYLSIKAKLWASFFFVFDEKLRDHIIQSTSRYLVEILVIELFYELHHVLAVSERPNKDLELEMLILDFFDKARKQSLHFFNELSELRCSGVWIFVDNVVKLGPGHFLAILMKEPTLSAVIDSFLTDESRFFAVRIDTEYSTWITIDTLRMFFDLSRHNSSWEKFNKMIISKA